MKFLLRLFKKQIELWRKNEEGVQIWRSRTMPQYGPLWRTMGWNNIKSTYSIQWQEPLCYDLSHWTIKRSGAREQCRASKLVSGASERTKGPVPHASNLDKPKNTNWFAVKAFSGCRIEVPQNLPFLINFDASKGKHVGWMWKKGSVGEITQRWLWGPVGAKNC